MLYLWMVLKDIHHLLLNMRLICNLDYLRAISINQLHTLKEKNSSDIIINIKEISTFLAQFT